MTIRSNPPGALVYVDNYEIGTTPCSTDFVYYGTRKIRLVKDGYETLTTEHKFRAPWYEYFPLDFVSENIYPGEIRDERVLDYQLAPQMVVPTNLLIQRAEDLRRDSHSQIVPQPAVTPGAAPAMTGPPPQVPVDAVPPGTIPPGTMPEPALSQPAIVQPPPQVPGPYQPYAPLPAVPANPFLPGSVLPGAAPPLPPGAIPAVPGVPPPPVLVPPGPGSRMPPPPPGVLPPPIQREVILSPGVRPQPAPGYPAAPGF